MKIKTIDLWNDHKPSQSIDPFLIDYFDEDSQTFAYDEVILCPNLIGHYKVSCPGVGSLNEADCPHFNGGIVFLKDGKPIRLYLCQTMDSVEDALGHKYGVEDIFTTLDSDQIIGKTGKTLRELIIQNDIKVHFDYTAHS